MRRSVEENEAAAAQLAETPLDGVRYLLLSYDGQIPDYEWDFGAWHEAMMGIHLRTSRSDVFVEWNEHDQFGHGIDLDASPDLDRSGQTVWLDASDTAYWAPLIGARLQVRLLWNDYGTGRAPSADGIEVSSGSTRLWMIAAQSERQESKLSIQLGMDCVMVVQDERFVRALGLFDQERGRNPPPRFWT